MSLTSQLAIILYGLVMLACLAAARVATGQPDRRGDVWHWCGATVFFAALAALRLMQAEDRLRDLARTVSRSAGAYEDRVGPQVAAALAVALLGAGLIVLFVRLWRRARPGSRARLVLLSRFAMLGMVPLFALRMVSLHQVDRVLYSGPLRINWLLEGAVALAVAGSAAIYAMRKRARGAQGRSRAAR